MAVVVTPKQRFTLYLITLLFIWVNAFAAPYYAVANNTDKDDAGLILVAEETISTALPQSEVATPDEAFFQQPVALSERSAHSLYPAEESFEESEESNRRDEHDLVYVALPSYLATAGLAEVFYPIYHKRHEGYTALRNQPTYLLGCVFLI